MGALEDFDSMTASRRIQAFVEDLSNWYVRRSRRRFWKSEDDADKRAAYDTLYRCLVTLCHLLAPFTPFLAEEMYQNLVRSVDASAPESVHLTSWPEAEPVEEHERLANERLAASMKLVQRLASLGRAARSRAGIKIRQPLRRVMFGLQSLLPLPDLLGLRYELAEELNVKEVAFLDVAGEYGFLREEDFVVYEVKPNLEALGPRYGERLERVRKAIARANPQRIAQAVKSRLPVRVGAFRLQPDDVIVEARPREGFAFAQEAGYAAIVATELTPELVDEGLAREVVHRLQTMRRNAGFEIADRIVTYYQGGEALRRVMQSFADYLCQETLSLELVEGEPPPGAHVETHTVDGQEVTLAVQRRA
jgi:isoleucyl-tRNA synthetase